VDPLLQSLLETLQEKTRSPQKICSNVASRILDEVQRICRESPRIQNSGDIESWHNSLINHRLKQCLKYYNFGSTKGRIELQSTLSAMVYRYISAGHQGTTYQERVNLIEDFLQGFYGESLNAFRRESNLSYDYRPRLLLELAEYMAFSERYAKRRIRLPKNRSQQLIILRAQTFSQQQPLETSIDINTVADGVLIQESNQDWNSPLIKQVRDLIANQTQQDVLGEGNLREKIITELIDYLESRQQPDCIDYFILRLKDLSTNEIEQILGIDARQRDYLQQRFKYHLFRFALSHRWELVHQWLDADLEHNLGLTPTQWTHFLTTLTPTQVKLLEAKQQGISHQDISKNLTLTKTQLDKQWLSILESAWHIRNQ
jgi:hypothetical protein